MDWTDALQGFLDTNPDLPQGHDRAEEDKDKEVPGKSAPLPRIDIILDKKGRKGKPATIASGFDPDDEAALQALASQLKQRLACGGSARGGEILIQGDRRNDVAEELRRRGYKTRIC